MSYSPKDWLVFNGIFSYMQSNTDIESYWSESTYHVALLRRSELGEYSDPASNQLPFGGELTLDNAKNSSYTGRLQGNMNKFWGKDSQHNVNATIGFEVSSDKYVGYKNITRGYYPERGLQFATVSPDLYPAYANWLSQNVPVITDNISNVFSFYSSLSYSYSNLFTVNANMRYDGSNKFGSQSNDNLLPVWSASFSYNLNEHLKNHLNIFDEFLFKSSYGFQGNMLSGQSPELIISKQPYDTHYGEYASTVSVFPNENLKWERTRSINLGVEFSMFDRKLMFSGSYYHKKTEDAYMQKKISGVNGLSSTVVNGGEIINTGYDLSLTTIPIKTKDFKWMLSASGSYTDNQINTLPAAEQYDYMDFLNGTATVKGKAVSSFYSYEFVGLNPEDGGPMFNDLSDKKESLYGMDNYDVYMKVMKPSGRREPKVTGGFNTTLEYKNLRLNANFAYSLGAKTRLFRLYNSTGAEIRPEDNINRAMINRWQYPGDEAYTNIPAIISPNSPSSSKYYYHWSQYTSDQVPAIATSLWEMYNYSDIRVVSADYLKCSSLSLTYSFPQEKIKKWSLSRLETSCMVSNPFILCSKKLNGQTPLQSGFTEVQLSERPSVTLSVSVSF
jgi:outer membrane receptor protein involved in Fe transport